MWWTIPRAIYKIRRIIHFCIFGNMTTPRSIYWIGRHHTACLCGPWCIMVRHRISYINTSQYLHFYMIGDMLWYNIASYIFRLPLLSMPITKLYDTPYNIFNRLPFSCISLWSAIYHDTNLTYNEAALITLHFYGIHYTVVACDAMDCGATLYLVLSLYPAFQYDKPYNMNRHCIIYWTGPFILNF